MKRLIISLLISAASLFVAAQYSPENVAIADFPTAVIAAGLLAVANTFIRPVIKFITLPINFLTMGLSSLVINAALLMVVDYFVDGFAINGIFYGFFWALILGVAISVLTGIFEKIVGIFT